MLNLCNSRHDEICFEGRDCPICDMIYDHEAEISSLESELQSLREKFDEVSTKLDECYTLYPECAI